MIEIQLDFSTLAVLSSNVEQAALQKLHFSPDISLNRFIGLLEQKQILRKANIRKVVLSCPKTPGQIALRICLSVTECKEFDMAVRMLCRTEGKVNLEIHLEK